METNLPEDQSSPEPSPEPTPAPSPGLTDELPFTDGPEVPSDAAPGAAGDPPPADELNQLAGASQKARLSPADEERMTALLKQALLDGRAGVARAVEALPKVPWIVGCGRSSRCGRS